MDFVLNTESYDPVEGIAGVQGITGRGKQFLRMLHIQFQSAGKSQHRWLGGHIVWGAADLGKKLTGHACVIADIGILFSGSVDVFQQSFGKSDIGILDELY